MAKPFNHKLHIWLSIFSIGTWLPIYFFVFLIQKSKDPEYQQNLQKKIKDLEERSKPTAQNPGYKKGGGLTSWSYQLNCSHMIRMKQWSSVNSARNKSKEVWCDVCKEPRYVVSTMERNQ